MGGWEGMEMPWVGRVLVQVHGAAQEPHNSSLLVSTFY